MKIETIKLYDKRKGHFDNPKLDRLFRAGWKSLEKGHPFEGMTTKEILKKIRSR